MDDSWRSSSSGAKASAVAKLTSPEFQKKERCAGGMPSEEIKENGRQLRGGVGLGPRNLKKEPKGFMSTTTTALPRKKVLTQKNDAPPSECSGTYSEGNPEVRKPGQVHGHPYAAAPEVVSFPSGVQSHRTGEETVVSSETQPYDPLTNYLSPRPKFLRYNPNRRRQIYIRRQMELKGTEGSSGFDLSVSFEAESPSSDRSPSDPAPSPSVKQEGSAVKYLQGKEAGEGVEEAEEYNTVEEGEEEEEEERPSYCNLVWKCLLLFGVLFFSTCYISSSHPWPAVSRLQNFLLSEGNLFKSKDFSHEVADNVGRNLNGFISSNACVHGHFNDLANWGIGININRLDSLMESGDFGCEKLQQEGNLKALWAGSVISETNLTMMEGKIDESEESPDESEVTTAEGSGMQIDSVQVVAEGEIEAYASDPKETQYDDDIVTIEDNCETEGENVESSDIVRVLDLEHENGFGTGAVIHEEHAGDMFMGTEIGEKDYLTEETSEPAPTQEESVSDHGEEVVNLESKLNVAAPPSLPETMKDANAFRFHGMRSFTIVLVVLAVAASTIIGFLQFWKTSKTSAGESSASFPNSGMAADGRNGSKVANTKKMEVLSSPNKYTEDIYEDHAPTVKLVVERGDKSLNSLVDANKYRKVHVTHTPAVKLVGERFVDTPLDTARNKDPYERNPPAVKLLGEFSIAEQGISETSNPSSWRQTINIEELRSLSQEMSRRKSSPPIEEANQTSPDVLPDESATCRTPAQEEPVRKQRSGRKQEAEKVASTPVRRSSRIRGRVASPGAQIS